MTSIWAHRGASTIAPENTIPAFELALEAGADGIELDVQRTSDGVLVVCHDELIDRTSDGTGAIAEHTFAELRERNFGRPGFEAPLPTLDEVFALVRGSDAVINIELKNSVVRYPGMEAEVERAVADAGLAGQVWYSSFNHQSLLELASSEIPIGVLYAQQLVRPWSYAATFGADALHPYDPTVDAELVAQAHEHAQRVHVWTVDDPERMAQLAELGVDAIITNRPDLAAEVLATA